MANTLGHYLKRNYEKGIIDFSLRAHVDDHGVVSFYIRPMYTNGETTDYYIIGGLTIEAAVNGIVSGFLPAITVDCAGFAMELPSDSCPKCHTVQSGTLGEKPWFVAIRGGKQPNTPDGPGESWVDGIQTCFECGHQWEVTL